MNKSNIQNEQGIGAVGIILLLVVIIAVLFAARMVMQANDKTANTSGSKQTSMQNQSTEPPAKIQSKAEVKQAVRALDATNLDADLDTSTLNEDLSAL